MKKILISIIIFTIILLPTNSVHAQNKYIIDNADLLSESFEIEINQKISEIIFDYNADIVIVTTETLDGKTLANYADDFYDYNGYCKDGVLLLISLENNDIYISTSGNGILAFTDYGIDKVLDDIIESFSIGDFEDGISKFVLTSDEYFKLYEEGTPFDKNSEPRSFGEIILIFTIVWGVSFILSFIIVNNMKSKLTSIRSKTNANDYIQNKNIDLINSNDIYLYRNISRTRIPQNTGGSSTHRGSSGRSHGGGGRKF